MTTSRGTYHSLTSRERAARHAKAAMQLVIGEGQASSGVQRLQHELLLTVYVFNIAAHSATMLSLAIERLQYNDATTTMEPGHLVTSCSCFGTLACMT